MAKDNEDMKQKAVEAWHKTVEQLADDIKRECEHRRSKGDYYCYCIDHHEREDLHLTIIKCWEPRWDENDNPLPPVPSGRFTARLFTDDTTGKGIDSYEEIACESLLDAAYCLRLFLRIRA